MRIAEVSEKHFGDVYLNTFFKNGTMCVKLNDLLPQSPSIKPIPYYSEPQISQPSLFKGDQEKDQ